MMNKFFLSSLAKTINTYLQLDPLSKNRLQKLQQHVITIEFLPFHFIFQCSFTEEGVKIHPHELQDAQTKICGTPLQMLSTVILKEDRHHFFAEDLVISGNAEVGQQLIELFDELKIDWEEYLSKMVGDVPAYHTTRVITNISQWLQNTEKAFTQDVNEFLHEEITCLPPREALQDFFDDIDNLRMDVDRIEAKINLLKEHFMDREIT